MITMQLDKHLVVFANPDTRAELRRVASSEGLSDSAWLRKRIADEYSRWRSGAKQLPPLGEYRGTKADRRTITIRCSDDDLIMATELAEARRVSVSKMIRDMILRATQKRS